MIFIIPVVSAHEAPWSYTRELRELETSIVFLTAPLLSGKSRGPLGRCDRSRKSLDRLGVRKRRVPKPLGQALRPPLLTEFTRRDQCGPHAFRGALLEHFPAGLVDPLWNLFVSDEEIPFGPDATSLFTDGAGVKLRCSVGSHSVSFH